MLGLFHFVWSAISRPLYTRSGPDETFAECWNGTCYMLLLMQLQKLVMLCKVNGCVLWNDMCSDDCLSLVRVNIVLLHAIVIISSGICRAPAGPSAGVWLR